ncbi:MAG: hypothetical protein QM621_01385 [Aeromicrobium sp.]|uniref:hypothetical protein n=1 Tax=Aeromicrobium sp. TaxID=1871063 RepID=UPI0039E49C74
MGSRLVALWATVIATVGIGVLGVTVLRDAGRGSDWLALWVPLYALPVVAGLLLTASFFRPILPLVDPAQLAAARAAARADGAAVAAVREAGDREVADTVRALDTVTNRCGSCFSPVVGLADEQVRCEACGQQHVMVGPDGGEGDER